MRVHFAGERIWKSPALGIVGICAIADVDGDGKTEVVASSGKDLFVLSFENGEVLWHTYIGPPHSSGTYPQMALTHRIDKSRNGLQIIVGLLNSRDVLVYEFSDGASKGRISHTLSMDDAFNPTVLVADMDGDDQEEIVVTKLGAIYMFDSVTGGMKRRYDWVSGGERRRNYGLFQTSDIDNDGTLECVEISSAVSRHLATLDNDGQGNLNLLWDRFIEHIYPTDTTEVRHTVNSLCDVDGDGFPEIVVSLFNARNDERWWLEIIDPKNGETKFDIPDQYLWGVQDIDSDGIGELLTTYEDKRVPSRSSELMILDFDERGFRSIWSKDNARFGQRFYGAAPDRSQFRGGYVDSDEIWFEKLNQTKGFFILEDLDWGTQLTLVNVGPGRIEEKPIRLEGLTRLDIGGVGDLNGDGENEIVLTSAHGRVYVIDCSGKVQAQFASGGKPSSSAIAFGSSARGREFLAVPNGAEEIHLLCVDGLTKKPTLIWKRQGTGRRGFDQSYHSVYASDFDGDGEYELLVCCQSGSISLLQILTLDGSVKHEFEFRECPPPRAKTRVGIYDFCHAPSKLSRGALAISSNASGSMNTERTICIDLSNNTEKWKRQYVGEGDYGRGFGPWGLTSLMRSGEDLVEGIFLAKDTLCQFDTSSGNLRNPSWVLREATLKVMEQSGTLNVLRENLASDADPFTAYGSVMVSDVNNDGVAEFIVAGCHGALGVVSQNHEVLWWKSMPLNDLSMRYPGIADVDSDGVLELGVGHSCGDFACYSAATGELKWKTNLGSVATDVVSCDIDGDGIVEFIMGMADGRLLTLGDQGKIKWAHDFGFSLGPPVVADCDGDGLPEIIIMAGDGFLYCVGEK
jgi:outer membrane protein assembly factor BamB